MSANIREMKEMARQEGLEAKMKHILADITSIDDRLSRLNRQREKLMCRYEELKETKLLMDAKAVSTKEHTDEWEQEKFEWSQRLKDTMKKVFKLISFRPQQLQTINCVLSKKDVIMIAPTGGGKSLCYQLPALMNDGLTIVISPLISLIEDQVWSLQKFGVHAELMSASTEKSKHSLILKQMADAKVPCPFKILYVTPERLAKSKRFMNSLQKCYMNKQLNLIAVDEVHCISQFGNDFRPDYKFLGSLKTMFPDIPILGVTATATAKVIVDIQKMLNLPQPIILKAEFNRPNLYYHVMEKPTEKDKCIELLYDLLSNRFAGQSGIIYAFSIADTEEIANELLQRDLKVRPYHASLTNERRTKIHAKWLSGEIQAVVATVAFGMGIDKPDVRFVIHHTMSKSMENYYQESGRAGRDGKRAECILLYRSADIHKITSMVFTEHTGLENAYQMVSFAIDGISCRRDLISRHFMDVWSSSAECNKMCDRCYHKDKVNPPKMLIGEHCVALYKIIDHATERDVKLTMLKLIDSWYQKGKPNLRVKEIPVPNFERFYAEQMVAFLVLKGYLKEDFHFTAYSTISYIKKGSRIAQENDRIVFYGARVLNLPNLDAISSHDAQSNGDESIYVNDSDSGPPVKKMKKEKPRNSESMTCSEKSLDVSRCSSNGESSSKKKKRSKHEKERHSKSHSSQSDAADDCVMLVEGSDVIEID